MMTNLIQANMNNRICPVCGADMYRNKQDDPMNEELENCICMNPDCGIEATFVN